MANNRGNYIARRFTISRTRKKSVKTYTEKFDNSYLYSTANPSTEPLLHITAPEGCCVTCFSEYACHELERVLEIQLSSITCCYRQVTFCRQSSRLQNRLAPKLVGLRDKASDFCSSGNFIRISVGTSTIVTETFRDLSYSLQASTGTVPLITLRPLPFTSFPIHYIQISLLFDAM
jgi:hypothetical protein